MNEEELEKLLPNLPNQPFVPITPGTDKFKLPGKAIGRQMMGKEDNFRLHIQFDPEKLFKKKLPNNREK